MVGHLAHVQGDLTYKLESYKTYEHALSKVIDLKGMVKELTT